MKYPDIRHETGCELILDVITKTIISTIKYRKPDTLIFKLFKVNSLEYAAAEIIKKNN